MSSIQASQKTIPLVNLQRQIAQHRPALDAAMAAVLDRGDFIKGGAVAEFEKAFAAFCGTEYCIGVGNGTDALAMILEALDIGAMGISSRDEVILPAMSFIATVEPVSRLGAMPVLVDIDPHTYTLCPLQVKDALSPTTKAVIPVHLYGQPAEMAPLMKLAKDHPFHLIEDSAQAHGATCNTQTIGSLGIAGAFSFYPGKNLGAFGDGGAVTTSDPNLAEKVRMLANHGRQKKYEHDMVGTNSRLDTLQAAILNVKLPHLADWNTARAQWAALYNELLAGIDEIDLPKTGADRTHVYHLYVIQTPHRDALMAHLKEQGIHTGIHYPIPLHLQPAYHHLGYKQGRFPVSEALAARCLSLPMFPEMTEQEIHTVAREVRSFYENGKHHE
ncbi:MAG: DegT/DnrJ/EryC1/StrS family aminotransferase [Vampirovibrio sp.]|nr:DegT/DnrJ/EryC1/StrS family aminotransferase [Vampirovibrio sp.]